MSMDRTKGIGGMPSDKRKSGIGSSEIAAICGLNKWRAPIDIYMSKLGLIEEQPDNDNMYFGRELEPILIKRYEKETGRKATILHPDDMPCRHDKYEWFMYSPDGLILDEPFNPGIIECKTTGSSYRDEWGEPGSDEVPQEYLIQCQWLMEGAGAQWADIAVLFMGARREFRIYRINRDQELIDSLIAKGKDFWENHIIPAIPPPVDASKGWDTYFKKEYPRELDDIITPLEDRQMLAYYLMVTQQVIKEKEAELLRYQNQIKDIIGTHAGMSSPWGKITWKKSKDTEVVDWEKAFRTIAFLHYASDDKVNELIKEFTTIKPGPRVFRCHTNRERIRREKTK